MTYNNGRNDVVLVVGGAAAGAVIGGLLIGFIGVIIGGIAGFYFTGKAVYR